MLENSDFSILCITFFTWLFFASQLLSVSLGLSQGETVVSRKGGLQEERPKQEGDEEIIPFLK
jgi:hypothetical protein